MFCVCWEAPGFGVSRHMCVTKTQLINDRYLDWFTLRSSVCAYTLLRRVLIHADCRWPSPTPSTTLPLYEMITCFIQTKLQLGHDFQRNATVSKWGQCKIGSDPISYQTLSCKDYHHRVV